MSRTTERVRAAIIGGTGYGGAELIRLLLAHPNVELVRVTSIDRVGEPLDAVQAAHIRQILARCHGKIYGPDGAAARLGLKPSTLQSRMKKLGISRQ